MFKAYYKLTKPGIIYGNTLTAAAGLLLASKGHIDITLFTATLLGVALVIACGCVLNNYIDRGIDAKMARTKKRALVSGEISGASALTFAGALGILGSLTILLWVNNLVLLLGGIALFSYVVLYGIAKRRTVHSTLVGTIPGALPLVAGYCAVTGHFDTGAALLFLIMVCWQMPHFYAIAIFRRSDYAAANLPVLPVKKSIRLTKIQMMLYITAFIGANALLTIFDYTGYIYLTVMALIGLAWLRLSIKGFKATDDTKWARKLFGFSLIVLLVFCIMLSVDVLLP